MSHNAIDYFATLSRAPGPFVCQSFPLAVDEDSPPLSGKDVWNEAITDVIVVGPDDPVDEEETWIFVPESVNGSPIESPHLAFRRRKFSKRQDHISQIKFVSNPDTHHDGYEVIKTTTSGKTPAQIKGLGYIAIKRATASSHSLIDGEPMLYDICVAKKSLKEEIPEKYVVVERDISLAMSLSIPSDLIFSTRTLPAMGLCNLAYKPATVDRYPLTNQKGLELPEEALPVFAFPRNLRLQINSLSEYPLPVYYTFVFTDQEGHHQYAACLKFFERVPLSDLDHVAKDIWGEDVVLELAEDRGIFCPKVVCLLSSMPFYRAMRRYLRHMYSLSLSASICPIEHFISSVVAQVPLPVEGGRPFHVVLDAALISSTSRPMNPIVFELPHYRFFPMMDLDFAGPMRCMNLDTMLAVFTLLLRESKMLFVSCSNTMLTETMETLRVLLFPLTWSSTFVSRLPSALTGLLQAPGGFMLGLHIDPAEMFRMKHHTQEEINQEFKKYIQTMHFDYPMVAGTYIVDLTSSNIYLFTGKHVEIMSMTHIENLLKTLPNGPKMRLKCKLRKIADDYHIAPQMNGLEEFDSAFDFQANPDEGNGVSPKKWEEFPTMEIRDSFMSFMIDLLGDYTQYIIPPNEDLTADTFRTFKEEFAVKEYLHDADQSCKQILEYLMETQMFAVLLQQRSEGRSHPLVFFEQASALQRNLGLSAGGHDAHLGKVPICICELPVPIYKLLESENQWSCLSKVMQQQILQHAAMGNSGSTSSSNVAGNGSSHQKAAPKLMHLTTSALSPLRSLGSGPHIIYSPHPITNQRLLDLLVYIDFTKTTPHNYLLDDESNSRYYSIARQEVDRDEDLHLGSVEFGPLLLPGPVLTQSMEAPKVKSSEEQTRYTYANGWPMLNKDILGRTESIVHPRLQSLRKERVFTLKQINPSIRMFIRSPIERLALESNQVMRGDELIQIHHGISPMVSAIIDISSMAMSLLAIRAVHGLRPVGDILQILGIIAQLESWGLAGLVNETIWRSIFIACSSTGGDLIRRIAIVLKDCLKASHISPDALTFGQYMKSIAANTIKHPNATNAHDLLDQYLYLEEIGLTWYVQKAAMSPQPIASSISTSYHNSNKLSGAGNRTTSKATTISTVNSEATHLVASQLHLEKSKSFMPFFFPHGATGSCIPMKTETLTPSETLDEVTNDLQLRLNALHEASKPTEMLPEMKKALQPVFPAKLEANNTTNNHTSISHALTGSLSMREGVSFGLGSISPMRSDSNTKDLPPVPPNNKSPMMSGMMSRMFNANMMRNTGSNSASFTTSSSSTPQTSPVPPQASSWGKFKSAFGGAGMMMGGHSSTNPSHPSNASSASGVEFETRTGDPGSPIGKLSATLVFDDDEGSGPSDDENDGNEIEKTINATVNDSNVTQASSEFISVESKKTLDSTGKTTHINTAPTSDASAIPTDPLSSLLLDQSASVPSLGSLSLSASDTASEPIAPLSLSNSVADSSAPSAPASPAPAPDSPPRIEKKTVSVPDCNKLQKTILETFLQEHSRRGKAIAIHSFSPCECGFVMMDEEILSMWCHGASIDVHKQNKQKLSRINTSNKSTDEDDGMIDGEHGELHIESGINCPHCGKDVLPQLTVKCYEIDRDVSNSTTADSAHSETDSSDNANKGDKLFKLWDESVSYMSPFIVRFELEELILKVGESVAQSEWLHKNSPALFWNIIWYTSRCHLPTGFMPIGTKSLLPDGNLFRSTYHSRLDHSAKSQQRLKDEYDLLSPIVIGWKESVARTKAFRLLQGIPGDFVDFRDILPKECSVEDLDTIRDYVLPHLDGSPASLRIAMIHLADCKSLYAAMKSMSGESKGRTLYSTLLMLAIHCGHYTVYDLSKTSFNRDFAKECSFHRVYLDCIRCVLSQNDFKQIEIDEESLLEFAKDYKATAVRAMFGLLL